MMKTKYITIATAGILMGSVGGVWGAAASWKNNDDGNWSTASQWNTSAVPGSDDTAGILRSVKVTLDSNVGSIKTLQVGADVSSSGTPTLLEITSGGVLNVTDSGGIVIAKGAGSVNTRSGTVIIDGGTLTGNGAVTLNDNANSKDAILTIKNDGNLSGGFISLSKAVGQTATINIGGGVGESATTAGWITLSDGYIGGNNSTGTINTINFNHTSSRYVLTNGKNGLNAIRIGNGTAGTNNILVNTKAGTTVLSGANTYVSGTTVSNGATLVANYNTSSKTASSTGAGAVTVDSGGTLGGIGYVGVENGGLTTVNGILKPGDYAFGAATPDYGTLKLNGSLTLGSGSTTVIGINGEREYSAFSVGQDLTLDGTLQVDLLAGFSIAANETFDFQLFTVTGTTSGNFDSYNFVEEWNGSTLTWDTSKLASQGLLSVTAIPEPSFIVPGLLFFLLLFASRKRREISLV